MKYSLLLSCSAVAVLLMGAGCATTSPDTITEDGTMTEPNEGVMKSVTYDEQSWKTIIPDSCQSFSDGCNICNRAEGSDIAACTKKFCVTYEKPACLDVAPTPDNL